MWPIQLKIGPYSLVIYKLNRGKTVFNLFGRKKRKLSIKSVERHLTIMGYDLLPYGAVVALAELESGYNEVETASHIALTTLALDIRESENNVVSLMSFTPHGMALLEVLKDYKDHREMNPTQWQNDSSAVWHIINIDEHQKPWIDKILSDPIAGKQRMANSRIAYNIDSLE